ncbi:MAG: hypothetical protein HY720_01505 [Planctomycetes bacterium]|nr:hypothetical protein [Planctomycetota bacterium]
MTRPSRLCFALLALFLPATALAENPPTIAVDELQPGDRGYGLTVFRGDSIEKFDVEVIDIFRNALPGQDLILIRCSRHGEDGYPIEESGVIGGMSGSPIYFKDRLAGALAYGWGFQKEPIAGVTPIANMLAEADRPDDRFGALAPGDPWGDGPIRPVDTPLVVSGLAPRFYDELRETFEGRHFFPLLGGGGEGAGGQGPTTLEPGSAVAVSLMEGDVDFAAIGTVTAVLDDGRVLAFGHPFFQAGPVAWQMKTAWITTVVKSISRSNKLGHALHPVGTLTKDRQAAVVGHLGEEPELLPIECVVKNKATGASNTFRSRAVDHPSLTPILVNMALSSFAESAEPIMDRNTVYATVRVQTDTLGTLEVTDLFASGSGSFDSNLLAPFNLLYANDFRRVKIQRIDATLEVVHEDRSAAITSLAVDRRHVRAGETVECLVTLRQFDHREEHLVRIDLAVPEDLAPGQYDLVVQGGNGVLPQYAPPRSPEEIARWISTWYRADHLVASLSTPRLALSYEGTRLDDLPPSVLGSLLTPNASGEVQTVVLEVRSAKEVPWVVQGTQGLTLVVEERK